MACFKNKASFAWAAFCHAHFIKRYAPAAARSWATARKVLSPEKNKASCTSKNIAAGMTGHDGRQLMCGTRGLGQCVLVTMLAMTPQQVTAWLQGGKDAAVEIGQLSSSTSRHCTRCTIAKFIVLCVAILKRP